MSEYRTPSGRILTDADIEALADEAEQGYDVSSLGESSPEVHARLRELVEHPAPPAGE